MQEWNVKWKEQVFLFLWTRVEVLKAVLDYLEDAIQNKITYRDSFVCVPGILSSEASIECWMPNRLDDLTGDTIKLQVPIDWTEVLEINTI